ncbi:dedicator of cytokinesis protein 6 [Acrasis kona]|uniref:Dedicator of cytokinesis protein 6 n=1 Tax=Acrasis kona TaxID=1008807 RepID=A0AAW2ZPU2_9EUKA
MENSPRDADKLSINTNTEDDILSVVEEEIPDVIDLNEFASNIRNFPNAIFTCILNIYNESENKKKQKARSKSTLTGEPSRKTVDKSLFPLRDDAIVLQTTTLPECLLKEYEHPNVLKEMGNLDPHLQYAYSHLYERQTTEVIVNNEYVRRNLDEDIEQKSRVIGGLDSAPSNRLSGVPTNPGSTPPPAGAFGSMTPSSMSILRMEDDQERKATGSDPDNSFNERRAPSMIFDEEHARSSLTLASSPENIEDYDTCSEIIDPEHVFDDVTKRILSINDPSFNYEPMELSPMVDRKSKACPPFAPKPLEKRLLFTLQKFKLDAGKLEPLFVTIFLYNTAKGCRVSENFYYAVNTDRKVLNQVSIKSLPLEMQSEEEIQQAIFTVEEPNPNIYVIIFVEKVLQQGGGKDNYTKSKDRKETAKSAVFSKIKEAWDTTPRFRMPLMWSYEPLYEVEINPNYVPKVASPQNEMSGANTIRKSVVDTLKKSSNSERSSISFNTRRSVASNQEVDGSPSSTNSISSPISPNNHQPHQHTYYSNIIQLREDQQLKIRKGLLTLTNMIAFDSTCYNGKSKFDLNREILLPDKKREMVGGYFLLEVEELDFNQD